MAEVGVADCGGGVFNGVTECFLLAYEDAEAACTAHSGVEEVTVEHRAVAQSHRKDDIFYF